MQEVQGWFLTAVYASPQDIGRNVMWDEFAGIVDNMQGDWMLADDFNDIASATEKKGGGAIPYQKLQSLWTTLIGVSSWIWELWVQFSHGKVLYSMMVVTYLKDWIELSATMVGALGFLMLLSKFWLGFLTLTTIQSWSFLEGVGLR